ncbi:unnamed protein product [Caenorhabditis brenneri]
MDPEGRLLKDTITGLSTDTTLHYVQNESFKLNFMEFFAVSNMSVSYFLKIISSSTWSVVDR